MKSLFVTVLSTLVYLSAMTQLPCDSVIIHSLSYDAFYSDQYVEVVVKNESNELFSYPAFTLLDANGDTVASEDVNFFGLGNYYQGHTLTLHNAPADHTLNGGQLVLTGNNQVACQWENNYLLCPETCTDLRIVMQGANFPSASHAYTFEVVDSNANAVYQGTMHIDSASYTAYDTVCLPAGDYSIVWERQSSAISEQLHFRVDQLFTYTGPVTHDSNQTVTVPFEVMRACMEPDTAGTLGTLATGRVTEPLQFGCNDQCILLQNHGANRILGVRTYDLQGRMIHESTSSDNFQQIPVRGNGIYIVRVHTEQGVESRKVIKY